MEGTIAMHFAPDMIPSGMALSGADMIWLSTVLAVWTRSTCAPRFWHQAQVVIEKINNTAATIFFTGDHVPDDDSLGGARLGHAQHVLAGPHGASEAGRLDAAGAGRHARSVAAGGGRGQ